MSSYLPPWPESPPCPVCRKAATTSRFLERENKSEVRHEDGSEPCLIDGRSPYAGNAASTLTSPNQTEPEFYEWERAERWAASISARENGPVYFGFVRAHDGHRKLGRVPNEDLAVAIAQPQPDGTTLVRRLRP